MSLVAQATGESRLAPEGEEATLRALLTRLLEINRLAAQSLVAARIGLPSGEPMPGVLRAMGIRRIPIFWERCENPRVEIHVRLRRRRRLRSLAMEDA